LDKRRPIVWSVFPSLWCVSNQKGAIVVVVVVVVVVRMNGGRNDKSENTMVRPAEQKIKEARRTVFDDVPHVYVSIRILRERMEQRGTKSENGPARTLKQSNKYTYHPPECCAEEARVESNGIYP
jgi:hypothetical protein